ncbi:MAG: hypothetical protein ABI378_14250 [Chitinophagaceae bacterium]
MAFFPKDFKVDKGKAERFLSILLLLIILGGILLRLVLFFQNRNLIIDEANIVRNLSERGFEDLTLPLKYEQYAPPVFLWMEKLSSILFGYGEKAMRLYPLLCGIGALIAFYKVATKLFIKAAIWLPLAFFAFGNIFIKYSAELKQYVPDAFIAMLLLLAALSWDMRKMRPWRFVALWILVGSLAIWASMPSVFLLVGVAAYYAWPLLKERNFKGLLPLILIGLCWLVQFAFYYETILKPQINSPYLQNYHHDYFLYALPKNGIEWLHNWDRIVELLGNIGGFSGVSIVTSLILILVGSFILLFKNIRRFFLIALPVLLVLLAAALKQFSLIDRVVLFAMPVAMLLLAAGFEFLWKLAMPLRILLTLVGCFMIYAYNGFWLLRTPLKFHEITEGMTWLRDVKHAKGSQLFIHDANVPTYIYYTELHPQKARWASLVGAHRLTWDTDYTQLTKNWKDTAYFLYTGGFPDGERNKRTKEIEQNMRQIDYFEKYVCFVYEYVPKTTQDSTVKSGTTPN